MDPIVIAVELDLDPVRYSIFKYIVRYPCKDGARDLKKAAHFIEIGREIGVFEEDHILPSSILTFVFDERGALDDNQLFMFIGLTIASVDEILRVINNLIREIEHDDEGTSKG